MASDDTRTKNAIRENARYHRLRGNPEFETKRRANYSRQNKRKRSDPALLEKEREANRLRMAELRKDPAYRAAAVAKVKALRERRRLDQELEHFLKTWGGGNDEQANKQS